MFPDLTGAVPAFLVEMSVVSMPGIVEFLPSMPDDLMHGAIDGVWLYTVAKLEHMEWNEHGAKAGLTAGKTQTLTLRCRRKGARILVDGKELPMDGDAATYAFREGETVQVEILF